MTASNPQNNVWRQVAIVLLAAVVGWFAAYMAMVDTSVRYRTRIETLIQREEVLSQKMSRLETLIQQEVVLSQKMSRLEQLLVEHIRRTEAAHPVPIP